MAGSVLQFLEKGAKVSASGAATHTIHIGRKDDINIEGVAINKDIKGAQYTTADGNSHSVVIVPTECTTRCNIAGRPDAVFRSLKGDENLKNREEVVVKFHTSSDVDKR